MKRKVLETPEKGISRRNRRGVRVVDRINTETGDKAKATGIVTPHVSLGKSTCENEPSFVVTGATGAKRRVTSRVRAYAKAKADMIATARAYGAMISQEERDINKTVDYIRKHIVTK